MPPHAPTLYRPPSEARSLVLQATTGCSYNRCTFCGMYRKRAFRMRRLDELEAEIQAVAAVDPGVRRVFLADGDALVARASLLEGILKALHRAFPDLQRVSCYASPQALQVRTVAEMARLRELGLTLYYLGVESGEERVLAALQKGVDGAEMVRVANKATEAGVKLSTTILSRRRRRRPLRGARAWLRRGDQPDPAALPLHPGDDAGPGHPALRAGKARRVYGDGAVGVGARATDLRRPPRSLSDFGPIYYGKADLGPDRAPFFVA